MTAKRMTSTTQLWSVEHLLERPRDVEIPLWQRDYEWGEAQFNALKKSFESNDPFLGNIVLITRGEHYLIVDGQQRLTTIRYLAEGLLQAENLALHRAGERELVSYSDTYPSEPDKKAFKELLNVVTPEKLRALQLAVTIVTPSEGLDVDLLGSKLFSKLNRQRRRLNAVDQMKARLVLGFLRDKKTVDADQFAEFWEKLRRIVWTLEGREPSDPRTDEELERQELRFMRLLRAVRQVVLDEMTSFKVHTVRRSKERDEDFLRAMKKLDTTENRSNFLNTLKDVTTLLQDPLASGLLLLRRKGDEDLKGSLAPVPGGERLMPLLQLQGFLQGIWKDRWLESTDFVRVLAGLCDRSDPEEIRHKLEACIREDIREEALKDTVCSDRRLLYRDWVLFCAFWREDKAYAKVVRQALETVSQKARESDENDLMKAWEHVTFEEVQAQLLEAAPDFAQRLPHRWGAESKEHWVAMHRGESSAEFKKEVDVPHNYTHISRSLNSRLRDLSIEAKSELALREDVWPTLRFAAAVSLVLRKKGPLPPQLSEDKLAPYLKGFRYFWDEVEKALKEENA